MPSFIQNSLIAILCLLGSVSCNDSPEKEETKAEAKLPAQETSNDFSTKLQKELSLINPKADGWESEAFGDLASYRLKSLGEILTNCSQGREVDFSSLFLPSARLSPLRPTEQDLSTQYDQNGFKVSRGKIDKESPKNNLSPLEAIEPLAIPLGKLGKIHHKFKIYRVIPANSLVETKVIILIDAHNEQGQSIQINAEWTIEWTKEERPMIQMLALEKYEEIRSETSKERFFVDCTDSLLPPGEAHDQLSKGLPHWIRSVDKDSGVSTNGYNGISIGDLNGDELEDLYVCQTGGLPNRILLQTPEGKLIDHSAQSNADFLNDTRTVLIIDLDQDRDNDLVLNIPNGIVFMENDGSASFTKRFEIKAKGAPFGMAAADPDGDGFLDIFICGYGSVWGGLGDYKHHIPLPMHDADNGGENLFLKNLGDWKFENQTDQVGLNHNNTRWSLSAAWQDYDLDGDLDLYVANDFGRNNLYQNISTQGGPLQFRDVAPQTKSEDLSPSMSASWGDPNNDGVPDIHVSNMFSGAGNRITTQSQFMTEASQQTRDNFLRMSRGNTLLMGGDRHFQDISEQAGITVGRWAWASRMVDINNDGWQDILVANGFMTGEDPADL